MLFRSSPHWPVVRPAGSAQCITPYADSREKVALPKPGNFAWQDILNTSFINFSWRYMSSLNQFPQPCGSKWIIFVVIRDHKKSHGCSSGQRRHTLATAPKQGCFAIHCNATILALSTCLSRLAFCPSRAPARVAKLAFRSRSALPFCRFGWLRPM